MYVKIVFRLQLVRWTQIISILATLFFFVEILSGFQQDENVIKKFRLRQEKKTSVNMSELKMFWPSLKKTKYYITKKKK